MPQVPAAFLDRKRAALAPAARPPPDQRAWPAGPAVPPGAPALPLDRTGALTRPPPGNTQPHTGRSNGTVIGGRCALPGDAGAGYGEPGSVPVNTPGKGRGNRPGAATGAQAGFDSPRCHTRRFKMRRTVEDVMTREVVCAHEGTPIRSWSGCWPPSG
jgi:hypothetical protein